MKMIRLYLSVLLFLMVGVLSCKAQLLETRQSLSFNIGHVAFNGRADNYFFPATANQNGMLMELIYGQRILPWMIGGVSFAYNHLEAPYAQPGFSEVITEGSTLISVGPQFVVHSPFKISGVFNWLRMGLAVTPLYHYFSGDRTLLIDNEVIPVEGVEYVPPKFEMNAGHSGFGLQFSPELNYRITQRIGARIAYNMQLASMSTGYNREKILAQSFTAGLLFTFGNDKKLF